MSIGEDDGTFGYTIDRSIRKGRMVGRVPERVAESTCTVYNMYGARDKQALH